LPDVSGASLEQATTMDAATATHALLLHRSNIR
jgi:hypothetical protein